MKFKHKLRRAFTLAELLVSLTVIGVIAALTMPVIYTNYQKAVLESSFKKAHVLLDEATKMISYNNRAIVRKAYELCPSSSGSYYCYASDLKNAYYQTLKVTSNFDRTRYTLTSYNGKAKNPSSGGRLAYPDKVLGNGMLFGIMINQAKINVTIDTNGKKKPNRLGFDVFCFQVDSNGELQSIKMSKDFTEEEKAAFDAANAEAHRRLGHPESWTHIDQNDAGDPCSITSKQKANGYGCSWYAIANKYPHDSTKTYWDNLP